MRRFCWIVAATLLAGCTPPDGDELTELPDDAQALSLLGDTLYPPSLPDDVRTRYEDNLAAARQRYDADPTDIDAIIWLGRRTAYLGRYREAIAIYTDGIDQAPTDARLFRHRGHRYITLRRFDLAVADLRRAAELTVGSADEVEPDGLPNDRNIPTSTLQSNIWYHLALAHYLQGDFEPTLAAYRECLARSTNPDMLVATSHWLYMTLRRMERSAEAERVLDPITGELDVIENGSYHRLLLMYKGEVPADSILGPNEDALQSATVGYGIGNWHFYNGRPDEARRIFETILSGPQWAAFGYIAAEAETARLRQGAVAGQ